MGRKEPPPEPTRKPKTREERMQRLQEFKDQRKPKFKAFNIDDFVSNVDEVLEVDVEKLGIIVKYKRLTNQDILAVSKIRDEGERGLEVFYLLLSKADPSVTKEKVRAMNPVDTTLIIEAINKETPLFLT